MAELTREYFDKQLGNLATKQDLKNLATKDELKNLVTKDELKNLATKEELRKLATKEDLKGLRVSLEAKIEKEVGDLARMTSNRFDEMEVKLDVRSRVTRIEQALDIK